MLAAFSKVGPPSQIVKRIAVDTKRSLKEYIQTGLRTDMTGADEDSHLSRGGGAKWNGNCFRKICFG